MKKKDVRQGWGESEGSGLGPVPFGSGLHAQPFSSPHPPTAHFCSISHCRELLWTCILGRSGGMIREVGKHRMPGVGPPGPFSNHKSEAKLEKVLSTWLLLELLIVVSRLILWE